MDALIAMPGAAVIALLVAVAAALWWFMRGRPTKPSAPQDRRLDDLDTLAGWPPEATRMLSGTERRAMQLLVQALPECLVFAQVPLARFIKVPGRHSYTEWMRRVGQASVDFLICDAEAQVIAAVELRRAEDEESNKAQRRHRRMDRVLQAAGIKVHVWRDGLWPPPELARELLLDTPGRLRTEDGQASVRTRELPAGPRLAPLNPAELPDEVVELRDPPASTWFDEMAPTQHADLGPDTIPVDGERNSAKG
jgi:hypothetical protein